MLSFLFMEKGWDSVINILRENYKQHDKGCNSTKTSDLESLQPQNSNSTGSNGIINLFTFISIYNCVCLHVCLYMDMYLSV